MDGRDTLTHCAGRRGLRPKSPSPLTTTLRIKGVGALIDLTFMEMDGLLVSGKIFIVTYHQDTLNETAEDFRTRGIWFRKNRARLAGRCAAMVAIVPSEDQRQAFAVDMEKQSRGLGVR